MFKMMIWGVDFEQDLRPLIKAFYPGCDFAVQKEEIRENIGDTAEWLAFLGRCYPQVREGRTENGGLLKVQETGKGEEPPWGQRAAEDGKNEEPRLCRTLLFT